MEVIKNIEFFMCFSIDFMAPGPLEIEKKICFIFFFWTFGDDIDLETDEEF